MHRIKLSVALVVFAVARLTNSTCAQDSKKSAGEQPNPEVVLRQMVDYICTVPAFSCRIDMTIRVQAQGMDNRMTSKMVSRLQRPNRFALVLEEGMMGVTMVSDGKSLAQYLPMLNRYSIQEAPADLSEWTNEGNTGPGMIGMPGAMIPTNPDAFYKSLMDSVTSSEYVGTEEINGSRYHRCRFMQENLHWDIWIEVGDRPLVYKIIPDISKSLADAEGVFKDAKMEYSIVFADWNVAPTFTDDDFKFEPPATAEKVDSLFAGLAGGGGEGPHPLLGEPAPPFKTVDLDEKPIDLEGHIGKSVVMLDFWATWCGPCVEAMPHVEAVAKKHADQGLVFYAVNVGEDAETIKAFLKDQKLEVPVALDLDNSIAQLYQASGIPQTVLIGQDGKIQVVHVGFAEGFAEMLSQEVEDLLAGKDLAAAAKSAAESSDTTEEDYITIDEPVNENESEDSAE